MKRKRLVCAAGALMILAASTLTSCDHVHSYVIAYEEKPTCMAGGQIEYQCVICEEEYRTYAESVGHSYAVIEERAATCAANGYKDHRCTACGNEYTETLAASGHIYTPGDCAVPQLCTRCNETVVWGHITGENYCTRCDACIFETMVYTGTGSGMIEPIDLPLGSYRITVAYAGAASVTVYLNDGYIGTSYPQNPLLHMLVPTPTDRYTTEVGTPLAGGRIELKTTEAAEWTLTIEAVRG